MKRAALLLTSLCMLKRNTVVILAEAVEILIAVCGTNKLWNEQHHSAFPSLQGFSKEINRLPSLFLFCCNGMTKENHLSV